MEVPSLGAVDQLYSQKISLNFVNFDNRDLAVLNRETTRLFSSLGDLKELSVWPEIVILLKKLRFELAILPLPPRQFITDHLISRLGSALQICRASFPDNVEQLLHVIKILRSLNWHENQFIGWIKTECMKNNHQEVCICPPNTKYVKLIEDFIATDEVLSKIDLKVVSTQSLKQFIFYDRIFFCGSIDLFSENQFRDLEYVWRSPRANDLYFLSYDWIKSSFSPKPSFNAVSDRLPVSVQSLSVKDTGSDVNNDISQNVKNKIDISDIDFTFNDMLPSGSSIKNPEINHCEVICECRLFILEDESYIYLEVEGSSRIVIFIPQTEIQRIPNSELETGMSLVVRTEGSGDSIAAVADILFKEEADEIRTKQEEWKVAFRKRLFTYSTADEVADVLTSLGAPTANEVNVRNWQRSDTIKPHKKDDFRAIMVFSGLNEMVDKYWENARRIDLAHKKAGKVINKFLLNKIKDSAEMELEKYGRIDIEIDGLTGKLSVVRIESISPEIYEVPYGQLNKIVNIEGASKWRE